MTSNTSAAAPAGGPAPSPGALQRADDGRLLQAKVMMVDDEPITLDVVQAYLEDAGYRHFVTVSEPARALGLFVLEKPDVLLLDLMMPGVSGFDILREIRAQPAFEQVPVIVLTSSTDAPTKLKALEMGATDFLAKPVDASELVVRLRNTLAAKAYLERLASYDALTGLYNRQMFGDHIDWMLRLAKREKHSGALLHFNVDQFRKINEALGPAMGDEFLRQLAQRLRQVARDCDSVARIAGESAGPQMSRLSGDEFAVLLTHIDLPEHATQAANRFLGVMRAPFQVGGQQLFMTARIGIPVFPNDGVDREILVQQAAAALNVAKSQGGNTCCFYAKEMNERSRHALNLQSELHNAIARNEFRLFYQPKVDAQSEALSGAEALIRWAHPTRGIVGPAEFIALAEESGLIVDIGAWVLRDACRQITAWIKQGLTPPTVAVNISARQFARRDFLSMARSTLDDFPFDRRYLQLELTESAMMGDVEHNIQTLDTLREWGLHLSIDDFGTGYSSLSYLRQFPLNELKVDRSFVKEVDAQGKNNTRAVITAIIAMAHALGLNVVAEGVETPEQAQFLRTQGCDHLQGYLYSKPVPVDEFTSRFMSK